MLAQKLDGDCGQTVLVDNRAGAGGNIGADRRQGPARRLHAAVRVGQHSTMNPADLQAPVLRPLKDLVPITTAASTADLVVHPSIRHEDREGTDRHGQGQARHDRTSPRPASAPPGHLAAEDFAAPPASTSCTCPTRAEAPASPTSSAISADHVRQLRRRIGPTSAPATAGARGHRPSALPLLPDVPTIAELGLPIRDRVAGSACWGRPARRPRSSPRSSATRSRCSPQPTSRRVSSSRA